MRDGSKQLIAGMLVHFWNLLAAVVLNNWQQKRKEQATGAGILADECDWYWVQIVVDCSIGVFFTYNFLKLSERVFQYKSGVYYEKKDYITQTISGFT